MKNDRQFKLDLDMLCKILGAKLPQIRRIMDYLGGLCEITYPAFRVSLDEDAGNLEIGGKKLRVTYHRKTNPVTMTAEMMWPWDRHCPRSPEDPFTACRSDVFYQPTSDWDDPYDDCFTQEEIDERKAERKKYYSHPWRQGKIPCDEMIAAFDESRRYDPNIPQTMANANLLDFYLEHPEFIPSWVSKVEDTLIQTYLFIGSVYEDEQGEKYFRCMRSVKGKLTSGLYSFSQPPITHYQNDRRGLTSGQTWIMSVAEWRLKG